MWMFEGNLTISHLIMSSNTASAFGGSLYSSTCSINMNDTLVSLNNANENGAGLWLLASTIITHNAKFSNNVALS